MIEIHNLWDIAPGDMCICCHDPSNLVNYCFILGVRNINVYDNVLFRDLHLLACNETGNVQFFIDQITKDEPIPSTYKIFRLNANS